ncbi:MAG: hypothetical protein ACHQJ5_11610, partial [Vicinamibacteria bacterium]
MELHQHVGDVILARDRLERGGRRSLIRRLRARLFTTGFDNALAAGADPIFDPALALRTERLTSPRTRRQLAAGLHDVI